MGLKYSIMNLVDLATLLSVTSEDPIFTKDHLYNQRPSYPFRFTAKSGNQILVDLGAPTLVTMVGVFNHNLTSGAGQFKIKAAAANPPAGGDWDSPDWNSAIPITANFNDSFLRFSKTYRYWVLDIDDGSNPDNIEIGEFFLGLATAFSSKVYLQPARTDGPAFFMARQQTYYGQDWSAYLSEAERFAISIKDITDPSVVDEVAVWLRAVQRNAGKFIFIPDDNEPFAYYVIIENLADYASRLVHGPTADLRQWNFQLKALTKGISLLG
jgi:hypothetical protein